MADEQFRGEDPVDVEGRNATQRRMEEEGTVSKDVGPADVEEREPAEQRISAADDDVGQVVAD